VLVGLGVVVYLVDRAGPREVWASIRELGWRLLIVLAVPFSLAVVLDALGWRVLLREHGVPLTVLAQARLAGEAVNLSTPTASVGGEPLKAYFLRPYTPLSDGLASVIVDKTVVLASQVLLLLAGLYLGARIVPLSHPLMRGMGGILGVELLAIGAFVLVQLLGVFGGGGRILGRLGFGRVERYQDGLNAVDRSLAVFYRRRRGRLLVSALLHAAAWASGALEVYLFLYFLGIDVSPATALVIEAFASAVKFASFMIPASLGALEGGYVFIFGALGLGGPLALSYTLARRLREAAAAGLGFLCLAAMRLRSRPAEWPGVAQGAEERPDR